MYLTIFVITICSECGDGGCCITIIILADGARHFLITKLAFSHPVRANKFPKGTHFAAATIHRYSHHSARVYVCVSNII